MKTQENENKSLYLWGSICVALIIGIWLFSYFDLKGDFENRGSFGDMFGGVNALFSGLALAGIIFTILLQRKELELQREELKETRKEFQQQNETMLLQRFENTFFNSLDLLSKLTSQLEVHYTLGLFRNDIENELVQAKGRIIFSNIYDTLRDGFDTIPSAWGEKTDYKLVFRMLYQVFFEEYYCELTHYFKTIEVVLLSIYTNNELDYEAKEKYRDILLSQLTDYELHVLFYYALVLEHDKYDKRLKELIENMRLFQKLNVDFIDPLHLDLYATQAFDFKINIP